MAGRSAQEIFGSFAQHTQERSNQQLLDTVAQLVHSSSDEDSEGEDARAHSTHLAHSNPAASTHVHAPSHMHSPSQVHAPSQAHAKRPRLHVATGSAALGAMNYGGAVSGLNEGSATGQGETLQPERKKRRKEKKHKHEKRDKREKSDNREKGDKTDRRRGEARAAPAQVDFEKGLQLQILSARQGVHVRSGPAAQGLPGNTGNSRIET